MEKNQTGLNSTSYIKSTLENIGINSQENLNKINELTYTLEKASKAIILPVLKIQKKLSNKLNSYTKNYNDIKNKALNSLNEIIDKNKEENNNNLNINFSDQLFNQNLKYSNDHEELISLYKNITNSIDLFTNLYKSKEFEHLIKGFDKIIKDEDFYDKENIINDLDKKLLKENKNNKNVVNNNNNKLNIKKNNHHHNKKHKTKKNKIKKKINKHNLNKNNNNNNINNNNNNNKKNLN